MKSKLLICIPLAIYLGACAAPKPKVNDSRQATWIENFSSSEVTILASGLGVDQEDALVDLRRSALWFLLEGGTDPLLNTPEAKQRFKSYTEELYVDANKYVTWESDEVDKLLEVTLPSGKDGWKMTKQIRINRQLLVQFLEKKNIVQSKEKLSDAQGTPMIMVIPEVPAGQTVLQVLDNNPLAKHAAATIESYLTARKYDVVVPRQIEQINQIAELTGESKKIESDEAYQIALSLGTDIYFSYSGRVESGKASVQVKAYETSTGRLLGTETGYSNTRPNATMEPLVEEAVGNTMTQVLQRVTNYWTEDNKKGIQYKVILKVRGKFTEDQIIDIQDDIDLLLKEKFNQKKVNIVTDKTLDYLIWADRETYSSASEVERAFRKAVEGPAKIRRISVNKKLIILAIDNQ